MSANPMQGWGWSPVPELPQPLNQRLQDLARFVKRLLTGFRQASVTVTAAYTVLPYVYLVRANAVAGAITVTLPKAAEQKGRILVIKKIDASANAVTVDGNGAETIDGALTLTTTTQYASATLQSNGVSWDALTEKTFVPVVASAPAIALSTRVLTANYTITTNNSAVIAGPFSDGGFTLMTEAGAILMTL